MTRTKEILKEAEKAASANTQIIGDWGEHYLGFIHGAEWADAHPHWISVEERKPKLKHKFENTQYSDTVIVTDGEYRTSASWKHNMWAGWYGWYKGDEELIGVTHWMPMPQAPHHIIDANKKVDRVIGTADHIKTALDVLNKEGGKE